MHREIKKIIQGAVSLRSEDGVKLGKDKRDWKDARELRLAFHSAGKYVTDDDPADSGGADGACWRTRRRPRVRWSAPGDLTHAARPGPARQASTLRRTR